MPSQRGFFLPQFGRFYRARDSQPEFLRFLLNSISPASVGAFFPLALKREVNACEILVEYSFLAQPWSGYEGVGLSEGIRMARYFFHIKDGAELIQDPEGSELATMEDARSQALKSARELWADAIKSGRSLAADAVVIADEQGGLTFVPMAEALPKRPV